MPVSTTELDALLTEGVSANIELALFEELKNNITALHIPPVYADNAAALADSAPVGSIYAKADGSVWVVLAAT